MAWTRKRGAFRDHDSYFSLPGMWKAAWIQEKTRSDAEVSIPQFLSKYSAPVKGGWKMHPKDIVISSTSVLFLLYCYKSTLRRCMASFLTVTTELETWRSKMALGPVCPHALPKLGAHWALSARSWGALCPGWKNLGGFLTWSDVLLITGWPE